VLPVFRRRKSALKNEAGKGVNALSLQHLTPQIPLQSSQQTLASLAHRGQGCHCLLNAAGRVVLRLNRIRCPVSTIRGSRR